MAVGQTCRGVIYMNSIFSRKCNFEKTVPFLCISIVLSSLQGCSLSSFTAKPTTLGEASSGYTYIPIDPSKVHISTESCNIKYSDFGGGEKGRVKLLDLLPDNTVRMSMEATDQNGNITYGVAKVDAVGAAYKLTADYVNSDTVNKSVWIRKTLLFEETEGERSTFFLNTKFNMQTERRPIPFAGSTHFHAISGDSKHFKESKALLGTEKYEVISFSEDVSVKKRTELRLQEFEEFNVPVYVGVGLRVIAEGTSLSSDSKISGIGVIGIEAEAKRVMGSLTVQTLGVNSQAVASALPVQSELSRTTAENAFVAIGSIKAMLHQPETKTSPRVVGLYLPFPGGKPLVNAIISELSRNPVKWCPNGYALDIEEVRLAK